ncbi:3-oxoacyl-ACP synthase III family protein [Streptomyces sp. NPDC048419]|uniref:3-oxoacyl-ACP synthase III family protein n=1 Tax=Streptomyces sp. NPDC048419 TaxID=3365547 RepID=UPI0037125C1D
MTLTNAGAARLAGMRTRGHSVQIAATGYAYPSVRVDNDEFLRQCRFPIDDPDRLIAQTRMEARYWCGPDENTWTLARDAAGMALAEDPGLAEEIDLVIVTSGTTLPFANPPEPENAAMADLAPLISRDILQRKVLAMDLKASYCTGFLRSLQVADALLSGSDYSTALIVATEQSGRIAVSEKNQTKFCFLFGDAAGAVVLRRGAPGAPGLIDHVGYTDGSKHSLVGIGPDGASTINRSKNETREMFVECARMLLERNGLTPRDVDWMVPIQTHIGLVNAVAADLDWPQDRVLSFGNTTGFTGSASIPACIAEQKRKGLINSGDLILSIAVGAGMNCAGSLYFA